MTPRREGWKLELHIILLEILRYIKRWLMVTDKNLRSLQEAQRQGLAKVDKKGKQNTKQYSAFRSNIELAVNKGVIDGHGQKVSKIRGKLWEI